MVIPPGSASALIRAGAALQRLQRQEMSEVLDASRPGSRPTEKQWGVFRDIGVVKYRWVVAANQAGKSSTPAREIAWILNGDHPTWTRPTAHKCPSCQGTGRPLGPDEHTCESGHTWKDWGTGPLKIIVAGQSKQMMELELWGAKLKPLLKEPEKWREVRMGQSLQHVEHRETGDVIVFLSHADSSEKDRKRMQGHVAHYVWLDEMPASVGILEELQRRVDSRGGYFVATFTPKFRNVAIKKVVDSSVLPIGKKYQFSKFDNPIFFGKEEEEYAKLAGYSEGYIRAVLFGEWMPGDGLIYEFYPEFHGGAPPDTYSPSWRHVVVVDPATESKLGLVVGAEDPATGVWWVIRAEYVEGIYVPTKIIEEVERRVSGLNVVLRKSDGAATWFIRQAAAAPYLKSYLRVEGKNVPGRKDRFIRDTQEMLGRRVRIADWCTHLHDELYSYERDPDTGKIRKASKYHLIDSLHYFTDRLPDPEQLPGDLDWYTRLYLANQSESPPAPPPRTRKYVLEGGSAPEAPPLPSIPAPSRVTRRRRHFR